ncbi:MAG: hypothetical protein A3C50_01545 [Candidatus Staskawiczbacteria bacterium RIFCSPHIGHO2_02_FULL_43_16]|uniref:Uncharacterized protein n=1 Tax=Candidatus Staskawiczbacteria bacterium RIFCSPHIGHO2_01_FULL_41_41 TaxID=1802203 RepID=A0A1G2HUK9_9BACT|nr:MAG: hypothetical protein A2822_03960 [Candidatus Staskawiczbacteria bacterium RIFCSPHIGHO2_01_FULL_41_41]OGZ69064.1 MAG: hypothetical protein A3C50_01545 [Candidatus Staskawiczbacteria bacterium RIFCSPHIGHO2_02_FULL_43_16]OGZ74509.1 MAG: hypothetical protein A3A12_01945 [Candidatus Staskawiczbacteria bacterium RIFCSPLOWO2_01_FULL_43_17b]
MKKVTASTLFCILPLCLAVFFLRQRAEILQKGEELTSQIWLPEGAEVEVCAQPAPPQESLPFKEPGNFYIDVSVDQHKHFFGQDGKHFVRLNRNKAFYHTQQGKIIIRSWQYIPDTPPWVTITEFKHLGEGKLLWKIQDNWENFLLTIAIGLFFGFGIGVLPCLFLCIILEVF